MQRNPNRQSEGMGMGEFFKDTFSHFGKFILQILRSK